MRRHIYGIAALTWAATILAGPMSNVTPTSSIDVSIHAQDSHYPSHQGHNTKGREAEASSSSGGSSGVAGPTGILDHPPSLPRANETPTHLVLQVTPSSRPNDDRSHAQHDTRLQHPHEGSSSHGPGVTITAAGANIAAEAHPTANAAVRHDDVGSRVRRHTNLSRRASKPDVNVVVPGIPETTCFPDPTSTAEAIESSLPSDTHDSPSAGAHDSFMPRAEKPKSSSISGSLTATVSASATDLRSLPIKAHARQVHNADYSNGNGTTPAQAQAQSTGSPAAEERAVNMAGNLPSTQNHAPYVRPGSEGLIKGTRKRTEDGELPPFARKIVPSNLPGGSMLL
ncbi:hypothetical protein NEOLEDRAFT_1139518 [Neolentinus lepideus HHB14362 ss-1]|uniref:Uncharacterized protein n=1 Tax=Neolentinus lepideus HHB14362 ss-1 TaxID=1314782 RepID=A0A165PRP6_9AGAM|nr:hypothetical protein NEOLEDRAFT_1139518 [Neolentinus lepideus HHB14362 ss-1]